MRGRTLELDISTHPHGLPYMQRPYHLIQSNLVDGQRHFQSHHQPNLLPG
jgi:hypothetical protein